MGLKNFGKTQLGKYPANFNWDPYKVWLMPWSDIFYPEFLSIWIETI